MTVVNEAYGVDVADQVVLTVGERLERSLRSADVIGRIGGNRFGVVLANCQEDEIRRSPRRSWSPSASPTSNVRPVRST